MIVHVHAALGRREWLEGKSRLSVSIMTIRCGSVEQWTRSCRSNQTGELRLTRLRHAMVGDSKWHGSMSQSGILASKSFLSYMGLTYSVFGLSQFLVGYFE